MSSRSSSTTSLQELQALDKLPGGIQGQVERLTSILGLDISEKAEGKNTALGHSIGSARLDWSLKWLLTKLRAEDAESSEYVCSGSENAQIANKMLQGPSNDRRLEAPHYHICNARTFAGCPCPFLSRTPLHYLEDTGGELWDDTTCC